MVEFVDLPQPNDIQSNEREKAMASYMMMFVNAGLGLPLPFINLVASFIYYHTLKKSSRFVHFHSYQSFLSQLPITVINGIAVVLGIRVIFFDMPFTDIFKGYLIAVAAANIVYVIFSIIAAVRAYQGKMYYFIYFGRVAYESAFRSRPANTEDNEGFRNLPPKL